MPTRTPGFQRNGHADPEAPEPAARVAAAYSLLPDPGTPVGGFDNRRVIDVMLNGRSSEAANLSWYFYERIPELRYIARYIANSVSMARLYVAEVTDDPLAPQPVGKRHPANDLMKAFGGGLDGRSELLDRLALHLTVPGDSVLMGPDGTGKGLKFPFDQFRAFSGSEVTSRNGVTYYTGPDQRAVSVPKGVLPVRVWRQHPKWWWDADSATRSSFSVLREIDLLDQHVHATAVSRLAGAGLLAIPDEITIPGDEEEVGGKEADAFVKKLTKIMSLAIKNRESAAAIVPIVLRGPGDLIAQIQHFDFSTKFDEKVPELRTLALHRLALGMDVPPEVLMGSSDSNHWSAFQTDQSTVRLHTTPLVQLICGALTQGWLRPMLKTLPLSDTIKAQIPNLVVWYDLSNLGIRPNISGDAQALYDRFEGDGDTLRSLTGLSKSSAPNKKELGRMVLLKLLQANAELAPYALNTLISEGYLDLPKIKEPAPVQAPEGRPPEHAPVDSDPNVDVPGKRSRDKQISPAPIPPADGDGDNNG